MADDWRSPLVWSEKSDGSLETDIPDSLGQLRVRRVENLYFEIEATIVSYQRRGHCQSKFYTARSRTMAGWSPTVFARELPPRSAGFNAENRLYSFALTRPSRGRRPSRNAYALPDYDPGDFGSVASTAANVSAVIEIVTIRPSL